MGKNRELHSYRNWLLDLARQAMAREGSSDAAHDYDHLVRVTALAETIQAHEGGDLPIIWAAVAFHDIGQERERLHGGDHALIGAELAEEILAGTEFPQASIPSVQQAPMSAWSPPCRRSRSCPISWKATAAQIMGRSPPS